jgi:hypothetical protein
VLRHCISRLQRRDSVSVAEVHCSAATGASQVIDKLVQVWRVRGVTLCAGGWLQNVRGPFTLLSLYLIICARPAGPRLLSARRPHLPPFGIPEATPVCHGHTPRSAASL